VNRRFSQICVWERIETSSVTPCHTTLGFLPDLRLGAD